MRPNRCPPFLALAVLAMLFASTLSCFAAPGYENIVPAPVAVAMAGQDATKLPADCPPVVTRSHWYDRQVAFNMHGQGADGRSFAFDFASSSDAGNALEARRSDNERSMQNLAATFGFLQQLAAMAAQSQGLGAPAGAAVPDPRFAAIEARLEALTAALEAMKPKPTSPPSSPEVELPPDATPPETPTTADPAPDPTGPPEG